MLFTTKSSAKALSKSISIINSSRSEEIAQISEIRETFLHTEQNQHAEEHEEQPDEDFVNQGVN